MVTHIVCFDFSTTEEAQTARDLLASMSDRIPSLLAIEAGVDFTRSERSYQLGLVTHHADRAGLLAYQEHPVHIEVAAFIRAHATRSVAVDFEAPSAG
jgi:hypothetical protein